eukprot:MONOS_2555.1-p1 / transcript=MONOS_2555.1 / gene=MONOS_2555 / organism=Monocercomonoides_exilis_PA203 / gene_product=unspecified product / transcript_product=unspecified product / location=Mono_scaffold00053:123784-125295(+) / protein_length=504 / sequence_SO=supercontig / SO=protein_coding / is_pseudo=false
MKKSEKPKEPAYKNDDIQKLEKPNKINFFRRLLSRKSPLQTLPSALVPGDSFSPDKSQKSEEIVEQLPYSATLAPYLPPPLPPPKSLPPSIDISEIRRQQLRRLSYRLRSQTNEISPIKKFEMSSIKNEQASEEQHFDDFHTVNESESSASKQSTSKESKMTILLDNSSEDINDQNMSVSSLNANDQGRKCFTNKKIDEEPDEKMGSIDDISENVYQKEIVAEDEEKEEKYDATDFNETDETKMMEDSDDGKSSNSIDERSCDQLSETNFQERMETDESTELKSNEPMEHISFSLATPSASSSSSSSFVHPDSFSIHPLHQIHSQSIFHSSPSSAIFSTPISISNPNPRVLITSPLISSPSLNSAAAFNLVSPALLSAISPHSSFAYSPHPSASSNSSQSPILSSHSSQSHSLSSSHISPARSSLSPQPSQPPSQLPSPFSQLSSLFSDLSPSSMNISPSTSFPRPLLLPELTQKERKAQLQCDCVSYFVQSFIIAHKNVISL